MSLPEWMLKGQRSPVDGETLLEITKGTVVYVPGDMPYKIRKLNVSLQY